ncbi:MAG: hypothetical protein JWQ49_3126 [Edaphobacter sp.]|nr:hypothetical protein [Edaphobacter sp.]
MTRFLMLILLLLTAGCSSTKDPGSASASGTSMVGNWTVSTTATSTGNLGSQCSQSCGPGSYQLMLIQSPCTVTTPVGTFSVQGPACFIANNNSGQGSISGTGIPSSVKSTSQGVLIGVPSDPVSSGATLNLVFVAGNRNGNFVKFTGSGTITNGVMAGTGSCSTSTPICDGVTGTFSGSKQ